MSLRRFPWKLPRMTDNSFKLFAAEPTPGHDPKKLVLGSGSTEPSTTNVSAATTRDGHGHSGEKHKNDGTATPAEGDSKKLEHEPKHGEKSEHKEEHKHEPKPQEGDKKEIIKGPWRILRLLPRHSRHIIHRMLDLNPKTRAKMEEILEDFWVADTVICQQLEQGEVLAAEDHTHVLEPPNNSAS